MEEDGTQDGREAGACCLADITCVWLLSLRTKNVICALGQYASSGNLLPEAADIVPRAVKAGTDRLPSQPAVTGCDGIRLAAKPAGDHACDWVARLKAHHDRFHFRARGLLVE